MTASFFRKVAGYFILYVAASLFVYFLTSAAIYPYQNGITDQFSEAALMRKVYLPVLYASLSLIIVVVSQFFLIGENKGNELRLYSIFNLAFFGLLFACSLVLFILGLVKNAPILTLVEVAPLVLCLAELAWALRRLFLALRQLKEEKAPSAEASPKQ